MNTKAFYFPTCQATAQSFAMSAIGILAALSMIFALSGCAPAGAPPSVEIAEAAQSVYALQPGQTANLIVQALNGSSAVRVFTNNDLVMIGKPMLGGWGFVCLNCTGVDPILNLAKTAGGKGNFVTSESFSWLVNSLKSSGWTEVKSVEKLPPALLAWRAAAEYAGQTVKSTANMIAKISTTSLVSVLVVPAGLLVPPDYIQGDPIQQ